MRRATALFAAALLAACASTTTAIKPVTGRAESTVMEGRRTGGA